MADPAPMTAGERAERATMEIVIGLKLSPKRAVSAQPVIERALTEHTAAVTAALEAAERRVAELAAMVATQQQKLAQSERMMQRQAEEVCAELEAVTLVTEAAERRVAEAMAAETERCAQWIATHTTQMGGRTAPFVSICERHPDDISGPVLADGIRARATPAGQGEGGER